MFDSIWAAEFANHSEALRTPSDYNAGEESVYLMIQTTDRRMARRAAERWYIETLLRTLYSVRKDP